MLAGHGHSTEEAVVADEQRIALLMALDELREEDRAVLAYRYLFDMSESDMAQALSCAPGTVKSRLSRSLARLRENLARVAPLVVVPINFELWLTHIFPGAAPASASGLATAAHAAVRPDLAAAVLQHISMPTGAGGSGTAGAGGRSSLQHVTIVGAAGGVVIAAVAAVGLLLSTSAAREPSPPPAAPVAAVATLPATATPEAAAAVPTGAVVYGADLSDAQRDELQQSFGPAAQDVPAQVVSRADLVATLQAAGFPVDGI